MKKKIMSLFLAAALTCVLTACGTSEGSASAGNVSESSTTESGARETGTAESHGSDKHTAESGAARDTKPEQGTQKEAAETDAPKQEQGDSARIAVVYFSATGTTAEVAKVIAQETGAELFEIVPQEVYTSEDLNYHDDQCRANKEMDDEGARPAISGDLSAVSDYDVVYLGHPIWWGTAPRIIQTFLESYDLSKAAVYTFCTSGGSGIEQSVEDLQELYPDVNIISGKRFTKASKEDVTAWTNSLQ